MKALTDHIVQFGTLTQQELDCITEGVTTVSLPKDAYFSEAGHIPKQLAFVASGVLRGFYYDQEGTEITRCFINENSLVADYMHFEAGTAATESIQACTDCTLFVFSKSHWDSLSHRIAGWDHLKSKMVHQCMLQKSRKGPVVSQDATTRYLEFIANYPSVMHRVALSHVASYLGVTQQSLSRIRKNIR